MYAMYEYVYSSYFDDKLLKSEFNCPPYSPLAKGFHL